jgi:hypothetical protein
MAKLNIINRIALGCMTAKDSNTVLLQQQQQQQQQHHHHHHHQHQQQQQQQEIDRGQLLQQYFDSEAEVMMYCAGNSTALDALHIMSIVASKVINQAG